ncbi:hypothetical protein [Paenibacillus sp. 1P07SE]|uniref:hypothetical protein n=1 Tax=Paenibacillus sp. 1P07SE TaxID=3132209 RepID=UPI0039A6A573
MSAASHMTESLAVIARLTEAAHTAWVVGGSAGLMLRGLPLPQPPGDLDLYADEPDAEKLHQLLSAYAVDQPQRSRSGLYDSVLSHYRIGETQVELVGGFTITDPKGSYRTEVREVLLADAYCTKAAGIQVALVPLVHELLFNALRGRADRTSLIARALEEEPGSDGHIRLLRKIASRNRLSPELTRQMNAWVSRSREGDLR